MYAPTKTIKFGSYSPPSTRGGTPVAAFVASGCLPAYNASGVDDPAGTITFDAGINNTWRLELGSFDFPRSSGGNNMDGQLSIKAGDTKGNYDKVKINGLLNTSGNRSNTDVTGNVNKWFTPGQTVYSGDQTAQDLRSDRVTEVDISNNANNPAFVDSIALGAVVSQDSPYFRGTLAVAIPAGFTGSSIYILSDTNSFEISTTADLSLNTGVFDISSVTILASDINSETSSIHYTSNGYVIPGSNTLAIGTWWSSSGFSVFNYGETGFNKNNYAEWTLTLLSAITISTQQLSGVTVTQVNSAGETVTGWLKNSLITSASYTSIVISTSISGIVNLDTFVSTEDVIVGTLTISKDNIDTAVVTETGTGFSQANPIININKRYLEFTYNHNEGNVNYSGEYSGWSITLQRRIRDLDIDYNGEYIGQSININRDFRTRIKNHNPILKITEADGIESSGNTSTNKDAETINLHLDVSGSRPTTRFPSRISNNVLYDLSLNDITASNNTVDISSAFSGLDGSSNFILVSIGRVGLLGQSITVDVSANTFRNEYGNWNDVSGGDFDKFIWTYTDNTGPELVITSEIIANNGITSTAIIPIKFTFTEEFTSPSIADLSNNYIDVSGGVFTSELITSDNKVYTANFTPDGVGSRSRGCSISVVGVFSDNINNTTTYSAGDISLNFIFNNNPTTIEIDKGVSEVAKAPFYGYYDYSQFGVIYTVSDMTVAANAAGITLTNGCTISSLFFEFNDWANNYTTTSQSQTVKMANISSTTTYIEKGPTGGGDSTPEPDYNDLSSVSGFSPTFTTVRSNFTFKTIVGSGYGWEEIGANVLNQNTGFTTNFVWDGTSNILVSWENRDGDYSPLSEVGGVRGGNGNSGHNQRAHAWYKDYSYPTAASMWNLSAPNIKFKVLPT